MSDIVVVDSGQTYESTESAIIAKNEADRAKQWAKYSEEKANLSEQSALEAAQLKDDAKAQADRAQNITDDFQVVIDASEEKARKWAVGTKEEQPEGSSKYWSEEAAKSAASVDADKIKRIAYDNGRNPGSLYGSYTLVLQDNDERTSLQVVDNVTITIDTSQLTFPKVWYTVVFEIYFPNGAKTVNLSYAGGIRWVNGLTPDFTNGMCHLVALTKNRIWGDVAMSDAGGLGG